jgi:hypothetical protein
MRSVLRLSEGTLEAADGVFASPDGSAVLKDVGLARFYRLRSLRCSLVVEGFVTASFSAPPKRRRPSRRSFPTCQSHGQGAQYRRDFHAAG